MNISDSEWTAIVNDIGPDLYRFFLGSFPSPTASDLVQETLIRLVKKCHDNEFDPKMGAMKNYAFGIARYVRLESLKKKADFDLVDDESILDTPSFDNTNQSDETAHLRWAIAQLKPIEQELILQMIDEESSFNEIAKKFNMPTGTVKSHIHRAKEKLRLLMEKR